MDRAGRANDSAVRKLLADSDALLQRSIAVQRDANEVSRQLADLLHGRKTTAPSERDEPSSD
jgi:hypothetical protein